MRPTLRPSLSRSSLDGSCSCLAQLPACRPSTLRRAGLTPLRHQRSSARSPRSVVQAAHGLQLLQKHVGGWLEGLQAQGSAAKAVQAALAATAAFVQKLLRQIWLAAAAMQATATLAEQAAAAERAAAAEQQQQQQFEEAEQTQLQQQQPSLVEAFAAATWGVTSGAVERLRHTLTDASSTLESKWSAMEATVGSSMGGLFMASAKSAAALNTLPPPPKPGAAPPKEWQEQATREVVQHEEALYDQVFLQVYNELLSKDNRQIGYIST